MKKQKNGLTISPRSKKAAIELMNEYRYLVPGSAPIPEDYYIPPRDIMVLGMQVKDSGGDFYVSVQYLFVGRHTAVYEQELETFLSQRCYGNWNYPLFFKREFARHIAKSFKKGIAFALNDDSNLQRFLKYRAHSIEIIRVKVLKAAEAFASYPVLYAYYLSRVPNGENDYTVVAEYRYVGVDDSMQVGLLPHLFTLHYEVASIVDLHYIDFYN